MIYRYMRVRASSLKCLLELQSGVTQSFMGTRIVSSTVMSAKVGPAGLA